ncbi:hypothetical protein RAB80_015332 [Fusarium oxysporum f. sp. vasinfectum]|nr:hypothetical protein RAB80_015332 [Fusarium oxysporum f. sp. vasinfectum]
MSYKSVVLLGASGNLGKLTLPTFLDSDLSVTAVVRTTSQATFPEEINVVKSNFNVESLSKVFEGKDAVISFIPIVSLEAQAIAIEAAITAGVKRFIPSEYGSDSTNPAVIAAVPFFEAKKKYLDYLKSREDAISWTGLITGPFFDWGLPLGFWGFDLINKKAQLFDGGNTKFTTSNGAQFLSSHLLLLSQRSLLFSRRPPALSGETEIPVDAVKAEAFKLLSEGDVDNGGAKLIGSLVFGKEALEDHTHLGTAQWNKELGLPSETVEETVQRVLKSLE